MKTVGPFRSSDSTAILPPYRPDRISSLIRPQLHCNIGRSAIKRRKKMLVHEVIRPTPTVIYDTDNGKPTVPEKSYEDLAAR